MAARVATTEGNGRREELKAQNRAKLLAAALRTEVGVSPEMAASMGLVRLPLSLESKRSEAVKVRHALQVAGQNAGDDGQPATHQGAFHRTRKDALGMERRG